MKTLFFEGAGWEEAHRGEIPNCRIRTAFANSEGKKIYLEILGYEKSVDDEKKYKRFPQYNIGEAIGFIDSCHYITDDPEIDDCNKSRLPCERKTDISFSYQGILNFVNTECNCSFDNVIILNWLSGYDVFGGKHTHTSADYNFMESVDYNPARTAERKRIYNDVAVKYFDVIYKKHIDINPSAARLFKPARIAHSLIAMDDNTITLRSHTYAQLIDECERIKVFAVNY